ncbi:hypothetical protein KY312_01965 [Candidatus Woesearchaeota archaeon]|nr:hypothetical protein [Candidatus Woesearchaeota archaeon]
MRNVVVMLMFLFYVSVATASYISIQTQTEIADNSVYIAASNFGDEPARDVMISAELNSQEKIGKINSIVGIAQTISENFTFNIDDMNGVYPLIITTGYADANSYPFSSIIVQPFVAGENVRSEISGKIEPIELKEKAEAELVLKNFGDKERNIKLRIIVPKEISVESTQGTLSLQPNAEGTLKIKLNRFSALVGSTYMIYALTEYDENGVHYSSAISSTISVVEDKPFKIPIWLYIVIILGLIGVIVYFQFRRK